MNTPIVFDIETVAIPDDQILAKLPEWDYEEARTRVPKNYKSQSVITEWLDNDRLNYGRDTIEKAALMPEYSTIAVVGFLRNRNVEQYMIDNERCLGGDIALFNYTTEAVMLEDVWLKLSNASRFTGFNILGWDLPYLIRKSWMLGVKVPTDVFNPLSRYPYSERFIDLMRIYATGRFEERNSLEHVLKMLGLPPKLGSGKDFGKLWKTDRKAALAYNQRDLECEAALAERLGILTQPTHFPSQSISEFARMEADDMIPA